MLMISGRVKMRPRANNITILPNDYVEKTKTMLNKFGKVALPNFAMFWAIMYDGEVIDFTSMKYDGGMWWFLKENEHVFELTQDQFGFWFVTNRRPNSRDSSSSGGSSSKENSASNKIPKHQIQAKYGGLRIFNPRNFLWYRQPWAKFLNRNNGFKIPLSAYESALELNFFEANKMISRIREKLNKFKSGMRLEEMYRYIQTQPVLKLFNVATSFSTLVDEVPEVFYRVKSESGETLVFDGYTHGIQDLRGADDSHFVGGPAPEAIATHAIEEGMYQKTLLLINQAGLKRGLKINVWARAIRHNFYMNDEDGFDRNVKVSALSFFLALARFELIQLRYRDDRKNDIVAYLPRQPVEFVALKKKLNNLVSLDNNSESD